MSTKQAQVLVQKLNERAIGLAKKSKLPVFTFEADSSQNFGKQIQKAYQNVFDFGYEYVIAIGNDCPTLRVNDLQKVADKLKTRDYVLGPALDGGTYLIALSKNAFLKTDLSKITWQSDQVFKEVQSNLNEFEGSLLTVKRDMDTWADFQIAFKLNDSFFSNIKSEVNTYLILTFRFLSLLEFTVLHDFISLRAPPRLVISKN